MIQIYKQHRRWTYGVENFCYILYHFGKHPTIPRGQRIKIALQQAEGYWSLVTNPIMLFILGWAPIFLGSETPPNGTVIQPPNCSARPPYLGDVRPGDFFSYLIVTYSEAPG